MVFIVINNSFVAENDKFSIKIDNPLDSNSSFLRTNLKSSLINNLYTMKDDSRILLNCLKYRIYILNQAIHQLKLL